MRTCNRIFLALFAVVVLSFGGITVHRTWKVGYNHLAAPHDLVLERPALGTISILQQGLSPYDSSVYDAFPFNLTMYTPAYHYLVSLLPNRENRFENARLVSALFMIASAATLFLVAKGFLGYGFAALSAVFFFSVIPVCQNTVFARQDPMALFFSAASIAFLFLKRSRAHLFASILFALAAIGSKQSYISGGLALGVYLFFNDRRQFKFFGLSFLSGLLSMAILGFCLWGNGFYWSTFVVPSVSFSWSNYWRVPALVFKQWLYLGFAVLCLYSLFHDLKHRRPLHVTGCYFAMSIVVLLATLGKEGASTNYFVEPTLAGLLYLQTRMNQLSPNLLLRREVKVGTLVFALLFTSDVLAIPERSYAFTDASTNLQMKEVLKNLDTEISRYTKVPKGQRKVLWHPLIPNPSFSLGEKLVINDPFLYSILWRQHRLSPDPLILAVRHHQFDLVILPRALADNRANYWPQLGIEHVLERHDGSFEIASAIGEEYTLKGLGMFAYFVPNRTVSRGGYRW